MLGHDHSGKSTISGHLIRKCNGIEKSLHENIEREIEETGKTTSKYSWIMDVSKSARAEGHTVCLRVKKLETSKSYVSIIDAPGYDFKQPHGSKISKDHMITLITGISKADCAILVVSATAEEFENGMNENGSTENHTLVARKLGVKKLIVAVNKMDSTIPKYSKDRYEYIKDRVTGVLTNHLIFSVDDIIFIPVSGLKGANLVDVSENLSWLEGPATNNAVGEGPVKSLIDAIDSIKLSERSLDLPFRFVIDTVFNNKKEQTNLKKDTVVVGRVMSGIIREGTRITISPNDNLYGKVKSIRMDLENIQIASAGDNVGLQISDILPSKIKPGNVISLPRVHLRARRCQRFTAQVTMLSLRGEIKRNYCPTIHCHTAYFPCKFHKIVKIKSPSTIEASEGNDISIKGGETAIVEIIPLKPISVESIDTFPSLARIIIRKKGALVGYGEIKSVQYVENQTNSNGQ